MTRQDVRRQVLDRDNNECQFCKIFGILELTGVIPDDRLEVHHKTYERYNNEDPDDLITVCKSCHDVITNYVRRLRYGDCEYETETIEIEKPKLIRIERIIRHEENDSQDNRNRPAYHAQRKSGKPSKRLYKIDEGNFKQTP